MLLLPGSPKVSIATTAVIFKDSRGCTNHCGRVRRLPVPSLSSARAQSSGMVGKFPGKVRVVFMHLPINRSGISRKVALGSVCAQAQTSSGPIMISRLTVNLAWTTTRLWSSRRPQSRPECVPGNCYSSEQAESQKVARSHREAERLGVTGTPTIYVNGQRVQVVELSVDLADAIQERSGRRVSAPRRVPVNDVVCIDLLGLARLRRSSDRLG